MATNSTLGDRLATRTRACSSASSWVRRWPGAAHAMLLRLGLVECVLDRLERHGERLRVAGPILGPVVGRAALSIAQRLGHRHVPTHAALAPSALALAPDGRLTSVGHLMIACPFHSEGFARLFLIHPPAGERAHRLEALAGYRR
ncbi:MAG: hypothetical protein ACXVDA_10485 [Ktedonobacterales bacterium]